MASLLISKTLDFTKLEAAYTLHVRRKAANAGSTVVYMIGSILYEEDPKTGVRKEISAKVEE